jgi:hypothetical protein
MTTRPLRERESIVVTGKARVREQDVDLGAVRENGSSLAAARSFDDPVSTITEVRSDRDARQDVIIDDKYSSAKVASVCLRHRSNLVSASRG